MEEATNLRDTVVDTSREMRGDGNSLPPAFSLIKAQMAQLQRLEQYDGAGSSARGGEEEPT